MVLSALGVLDPSVGARADPAAALADPRVAAALVPASAPGRHASAGGGGMTLAPVPRGDSLALDLAGDPEQAGVRAPTGEAWGWVVARGTAHAGTAARVLLAMVAPGPSAALARRAGALSARRSVAQPAEAPADATAAALASGRFGLAPGPDASGAVDTAIARPWVLWSRAVGGGEVRRQGRIDEAALRSLVRGEE